jgi:CHAT domain-containing protein
LRKEKYHIFHFIGHGAFSDFKEDGLLLLEDEQGAGVPVSGHYLGTLLHDEKSLRLALLNACEGARTSTSDPYAGTAQQLVRQGIPAVIAMQFEVSERTAATLSREFYRSLADNYPVDAALAEARKAIYMQGQDIEWGIPVLYMRSPNSQLFDVEPAADIKVAPRPKPDFSPSPQKSDSGGVNVSIKGDVSGQFAVGNKITQISKPDDSED